MFPKQIELTDSAARRAIDSQRADVLEEESNKTRRSSLTRQSMSANMREDGPPGTPTSSFKGGKDSNSFTRSERARITASKAQAGTHLLFGGLVERLEAYLNSNEEECKRLAGLMSASAGNVQVIERSLGLSPSVSVAEGARPSETTLASVAVAVE